MSRAHKTPGTTYITTKPFAPWDSLMKTYTKKHEEKCNYLADKPLDPFLGANEVKQYPTGSTYKGAVGMTGYGEYTYNNGVVYRGDFRDGCFHGNGDLVFKHGAEEHSIIQGQFDNGVLAEHKILFDNKLEYDYHDWKYCRSPDRRYTTEFENGLNPDGVPLITPDHPPKTIPPGYYDTADGFYNPMTNFIYNYDTLKTVNRAPSVREQKWIKDNCRKERVETVGPRQDLFEEWVGPIVEPKPLRKPLVTFHNSTIPSPVFQESVDRVVGDVYDSKQVLNYVIGTSELNLHSIYKKHKK